MLRYKGYKLIKPDENNRKQIDLLIQKNNGSVFHSFELNKIIEEKFKSELFYLVDNVNNIQHAAVVHVTKNNLGFKHYNLRPLYDIPYAGFIGDVKVNFGEFNINYFESFSYAGFPYIKEYNDSNETNLGQTTMVDLSLSEDDIFNNVIHSKRRNMIRKAIKAGIIVKEFFNIEGLRIFWPILWELHKKLGYTRFTFDYYETIFNTFSLRKQAFILIAFKKGIPISGVFILGNNNFMHYYKGASLFNIENEGHGELLQWKAISLSKKLGSLKYDLCNINKDKLPAIYRFKTGISTDIYKYQKYSFSSIGYKIFNRVNKCIS